MSRPLRNCLSDVTYHITSRCRNKLPLIKNNLFKEIMIEVIQLTLNKYKFELSGYTIMDNHFHFIIKTIDGEASISRIVQYIKSRFAERYNKINETVGPFWNGRFSDKIVEEAKDPVGYFFYLLWYLAFNPVKAKYIDSPEEYKYSSINSYLKKNCKFEVLITHHEYFINLGKTFSERLNKFLNYKNLRVSPPD